MNPVINKSAFTPGQQEAINKALGEFIRSVCQSVPALGGHFLSGGTFEIKTMSGTHLRFGFSPQAGGLIIPGGIRPTGGIIK